MLVKLETPKRLKGDPEAIRRWERSAAVVMARGVAEVIRTRVEQRGDTADPYRGPSSTPNKLVSPRYPGASAGRPTRSGARAFATHSAMYSALGARSGAFAPSGGMWSGYSIVKGSVKHAETLFRGRSEGQEPNFRLYAPREVDGRMVRERRARGLKVGNALKAWTVLRATGINILALKESEVRALEVALVHELGARAVATLGYEVRLRGAKADPDVMYRVLRRAFRDG